MGEIHAAQPWWKEAYLMANLDPNNIKTFYVKFGDVLSKAASILTFILIGYVILIWFKNLYIK